jgi:hypothetical protein
LELGGHPSHPTTISIMADGARRQQLSSLRSPNARNKFAFALGDRKLLVNRERHHSRRTAWPGATTLVASGDVQQEEKIKTAGLETSVPLEKMPAGWRRSVLKFL